ncbi:hypothetical protein AM588_10001870 [Phytophthora nicotianae]|uniref:Glucose-methanol-choline oxidoreductase N-terminal domain-containing protein n=1 Tax=Phytophthora nicotianae TaxID=4792 RepID=A0A0W8CWP9_PHYNI|nr:hypothetical protein AM588_10001870 [Phytophthora nicotianae]
MAASYSDERSPLLRPGVQRIGRRTRLLVSGLALLLLFAGGAACVAIVLRLLRPGALSTITPLVLSEEYDAIVIGGGPAGSVVAKLLSDDPWRRVLLVEAGNASQTQLGGKVGRLNLLRALPSDLRRWQMENWTWEKALDIYLSIEDFDGPNSSYHSKQGFIRTSPPALALDMSREFIEACVELGIPRTADFNAPDGRYGAGYYHFNTRDGVRESAAKAFLGPILDSKTAESKRENFRLMLDTTVTHGEVIVTAGAINTPKILMLSGLGNQDALKKAGLPLKKHLPRVGMNLQDHPVIGMVFEYKSPRVVDLKADLDSYFTATNAKHTNVSSFGLFGSAGLSTGAFLIPPGATLPEIQLTLFPRKSEPHMSNSAGLDHMTEVVVTIALLHPLARSRVVLIHDENDYVDDNDIDDHLIPRVVSEIPDAKPEHLRHGDVWKISWAIGVVREIAAKLGAEITSPKDLNDWVFDNVFRNSHWVGSASMANSEEEGVVDNHLRVFGIQNLRVADASVIPLIPNGNVHSTVVMVANRAAQILREDEAEYRRQYDHEVII